MVGKHGGWMGMSYLLGSPSKLRPSTDVILQEAVGTSQSLRVPSASRRTIWQWNIRGRELLWIVDFFEALVRHWLILAVLGNDSIIYAFKQFRWHWVTEPVVQTHSLSSYALVDNILQAHMFFNHFRGLVGEFFRQWSAVTSMSHHVLHWCSARRSKPSRGSKPNRYDHRNEPLPRNVQATPRETAETLSRPLNFNYKFRRRSLHT